MRLDEGPIIGPGQFQRPAEWGLKEIVAPARDWNKGAAQGLEALPGKALDVHWES